MGDRIEPAPDTSNERLDADRVRKVVRAVAVAALERGGIAEPHRSSDADDIADRVAAQLTAPPPGHVCPDAYVLDPDDIDALSELAAHAEMVDWPRALDALDKILAAHRAPEPAAGPLPEVITCGTEGCMSSIKKFMLPSGWVQRDERWRCPRCKLEVPS